MWIRFLWNEKVREIVMLDKKHEFAKLRNMSESTKISELKVERICGPDWETHIEKPFRSQWELYHWMRQFKEITQAFDFNGKTVFVGGCGSGVFEEWLLRSNINPKRIVSMDASSYMLNLAQTRMKKNGFTDQGEIRYEHGWVEDTGLAGGYFDVAVYIDMLQHVFNLEGALREAKRIAKTVIIYEANALNGVRRLNEYKSGGAKPRSFYKWQFRKLLEELGFENIKIKNTHCIPEFIPEKLLNFAKQLEPILERIPWLKEMTGALFVLAEGKRC